METIEVAIVGLMQIYCDCPVNNTMFHNSTTSCSSGALTFSSILAHASDNGTVTATVLIETFKAGLSKEDYPTITFYGHEFAVSVPVDEGCNSSSAFVFSTAFVSSILVGLVACIIIFG